MAKFMKVYMRNKKQSNISAALRFSFLQSLFLENLSVKQAAKKWKIHYSSAKIIARQARSSNLDTLLESIRPQLFSYASVRCQVKEKSISLTGSQSLSEMIHESQNYSGGTPSQIEVVSTIGWSFLPEQLSGKVL